MSEATVSAPLLVVEAPASRPAERGYILEQVLGEWLGQRWELRPTDRPDVTISRPDLTDGLTLTLPDVLFGAQAADWGTARCLPSEPVRWLTVPAVPAGGTGPVARDVPVLYGDAGTSGEVWTRTGSGLRLHVDVPGSVFAMLGRIEETVPGRRDQHDRFPLERALAWRAGFADRPVADDCTDLLWLALQTLWPDLRRPPQAFRLRLTHDIDVPWTAHGRPFRVAARSVAGDFLKRRDVRLALGRTVALADARRGRVDRDPLGTFDFLMAASERHGLRSTFYFQAGTTPADVDHRYRLDDPVFAPVLRRVHDRGHEIGLHGSYGSFGSVDRVRLEADALRDACRRAGAEQDAYGGRQHYLRFRNPLTWRAHEAAGLRHDSTMGFAEIPGFRSGTCREHTVFDLEQGRPLALRERPLIVMDAGLFGYLGLGYDAAAERALAVVDEVRRRRGDAVVLYHNDTVAGDRAKAHYLDLVTDLARTA